MAEDMDFMMGDDDGILDYDDGGDLDFSTDNDEEDDESIVEWVTETERVALKVTGVWWEHRVTSAFIGPGHLGVCVLETICGAVRRL